MYVYMHIRVKVIFLFFGRVRIPRAYCEREAGFLWCISALTCVDCVPMLDSSDLVVSGVVWAGSPWWYRDSETASIAGNS